MDEIIVHPSKAEDTGTAICTGKHLTQCTVNAFSGSHQWNMPLMASALLGNRSIISSELYRWCGACLGESKSNAINLILRLFLYYFLHTMSS